MRQFTDTKERVWDVELNVRQMKRVRDVLGIDLVNVIQAGKDGAVATDTLDRWRTTRSSSQTSCGFSARGRRRRPG